MLSPLPSKHAQVLELNHDGLFAYSGVVSAWTEEECSKGTSSRVGAVKVSQ